MEKMHFFILKFLNLPKKVFRRLKLLSYWKSNEINIKFEFRVNFSYLSEDYGKNFQHLIKKKKKKKKTAQFEWNLL